MPIQLTDEQWANVNREQEYPVHVSDPATAEERRTQLQQFGHRAGWDDPEMDIYDDLDPRRKSSSVPAATLTNDQRLVIAVIGRPATASMKQIDECM